MTQAAINLSVVIPAAGIGSRFGAIIPKQYCKIGAQTVLEYTIQKFIELENVTEIIVVLSADDTIFQTLSIFKHPKIKTTIGGKTRAESVLAGLKIQNSKNNWTLVHDAVRPCIQKYDILNLIKSCIPYYSTQNNGAILAYQITDTIKKRSVKTDQIETTIDREFLWAALTPQLFPTQLLKEALTKALIQNRTITDEASALEWLGVAPFLVAGNRENIKITHQDDLELARFYLIKQGCFIKEDEII